MFQSRHISDLLRKHRENQKEDPESLMDEVNRILQRDLFSEKKILKHLKAYNENRNLLDEESLDHNLVFSLTEIRSLCTRYRLRFLDSEHYKPEIPFPALSAINELNEKQHKELKHFKVLGTRNAILGKSQEEVCLLCKTGYDNYYLIHRWGKPLSRMRGFWCWPLRGFEHLFITISLVTLIITLSLPTGLISLDENIGYWTGFRLAAYFHLLIFNFGVTAYVTFAFNKNFSSSVWNQHSEF